MKYHKYSEWNSIKAENNRDTTISQALTMWITYNLEKLCIYLETSNFCIAFRCHFFIHSGLVQKERKKWAMKIGKIGKTKEKKNKTKQNNNKRNNFHRELNSLDCSFDDLIDVHQLLYWWTVKCDIFVETNEMHTRLRSVANVEYMEPSYVLIAHIIWIGFSIFFIIFLHLFMFRPYIHRITCIKDHYIYVNEFGGRHRIIISIVECWRMVYGETER